jgi:hypothetical protein
VGVGVGVGVGSLPVLPDDPAGAVDGGVLGGGVAEDVELEVEPVPELLVDVEDVLPLADGCGVVAAVTDAVCCTAPQPLSTNDAATAKAKNREARLVMESPVIRRCGRSLHPAGPKRKVKTASAPIT